jgi:hypothetical protein
MALKFTLLILCVPEGKKFFLEQQSGSSLKQNVAVQEATHLSLCINLNTKRTLPSPFILFERN